jgi:hypothetical protein
MPRTLRDAALETRAARSRLKARGKPYYRALETGLHLGYRRPQTGSGKWLARHYIGDQAYELETLAIADDFSDADGVAVLSYRQAQAKARERMVARAHHAAGKRMPSKAISTFSIPTAKPDITRAIGRAHLSCQRSAISKSKRSQPSSCASGTQTLQRCRRERAQRPEPSSNTASPTTALTAYGDDGCQRM